MHDETEERRLAPPSRAEQEASAAEAATNSEARLAHEKLAELHREADRDPAGPADGVSRS
jgi:hypothetical protein